MTGCHMKFYFMSVNRGECRFQLSMKQSKTINKPSILVNPLLLDKDIEKIKEYLSDYRNMNEYSACK